MFHAFCETFITINYQIMKNTDLVRFGDLNRHRNIDFFIAAILFRDTLMLTLIGFFLVRRFFSL